MQLANAMVALGGDRGNTVPKSGITAAEIAVLMAIHGEDAVFDVTPLKETVDRSARDEVARLQGLYSALDDDGKSIVTGQVYPGTRPIVHQNIAELELPETAFATESRVTAKAPTKAAKGKAKAPTKAPAPAKETEAEAASDENSADDLFDDGEDEDVLK